MCRIRFGTLSIEELACLCAIYDEFCVTKKQLSWLSLKIWKKLTRKDCEKLLEIYLRYHTADEGLLKINWALNTKSIRHAYLHSLCTRKPKLTNAEEQWLLNCGEPGAFRCLPRKLKLSGQNEYNLIEYGNFETIKDYIIGHTLYEGCEAKLAVGANDKENPKRADEYKRLLDIYFDVHLKTFDHKIYTEFMAQWCLFGDVCNDKFMMMLIEKCNMDDYVLKNAVIRRMAEKLPPKYLIWYLAYSYIPDKDLADELLKKDISEHLRDMIAISTQRHTIHKMVSKVLLFASDDWYDDELDAYHKFAREENAKKRMADLEEFLKPRFATGSISPAMSAWVAARCPKLAKAALENMQRYELHICKTTSFINYLHSIREGGINC
ncbi:MAG: hypothetical protein IJ218_00275 [Alphaproteobacteria bacterium]|nr:hypothetical protein [Alphaproteobacteria bacterium]